MDEKMLQERYRRLMERSDATGGQPAVSLDTLEALAEDRLQGGERLAALDAVLADPAARTEFEFLREIARERPRVAPRRTTSLAAAAVLVAVAGGLIWKASSPVGPDPLRGPDSGVLLVSPGPGASLAPGDTLLWRPVPGALRYTVEVVTGEGDVAYRAETADTLVVVTMPAGTAWPSGAGQWWVTPSAGGSAGRRSTPHPIVLTPPR